MVTDSGFGSGLKVKKLTPILAQSPETANTGNEKSTAADKNNAPRASVLPQPVPLNPMQLNTGFAHLLFSGLAPGWSNAFFGSLAQSFVRQPANRFKEWDTHSGSGKQTAVKQSAQDSGTGLGLIEAVDGEGAPDEDPFKKPLNLEV